MISGSEEDLQDMLNEVADSGKDFCIKFSEIKSKVIVVNGTDDDTRHIWQLANIRLKRIKEYNYLRMTL